MNENSDNKNKYSLTNKFWRLLMIDTNWNSDELEIDIVDENDVTEMELEVVEGNLELPPDLAEENLDADQLDHLENAAEALDAADTAVEVGDYRAAQEFREVAEAESAEAGTDALLEGADSVDLEYAADHQDRAEELQAEQADLAQKGDYEGALETSREAVDEFQASDELAGGSDHSGTAQLEVDNMEWAEFHQDIANESVASAVEYADAGNLDAADNAMDFADDQQLTADHYGDLGEHGGAIADFDPSSAVETNPVDSYSPADIDIADTSTTSSVDTTPVDFSVDTTSTDDFST